MFHSKLARLVAVAAVAGSATVASVSLAGSATAVTGIHCAAMKGNLATSVKLSKCTGNTGGASKAIPSTQLATGGTIKWVNGKTTTVTLTVKQAGTACPAGSSEYQARGTVTADTTGSVLIGSAAKAFACVNGTTGAITLVPGTKATI